MQTRYQRHQSGFTLLELVLVLFLIGLLASAGLLFTENQEDQAYFDETQRRLETIRKAIIRNGERTVNGQPELAGFASDMGRLPYCVAELLYTGAVSDTKFFISPCSTVNNLPMRRPATTADGIRYGWWGPYIQVNPDRDGERVYRDGYNNDDGTVNFGWNWTLSESATPVDIDSYDPDSPSSPLPLDLTVQSSGFDVTDSIDDYPPALTDYLLVVDDWLTQDVFAVQFTNTSATSAITSFDIDNWSMTLSKSSVGPDPAVMTTTAAVSSIPAGGTIEATATFSERLPTGFYQVDLTCSTSCPENVSVPYTVMLLPRQQLAPIRWNVKP